MDQLAVTIRLLRANLADKDTSVRIDEQAVMLDGRIDVPHAPPSSVASVSRPAPLFVFLSCGRSYRV